MRTTDEWHNAISGLGHSLKTHAADVAGPPEWRLAHGILNDPQAHIDALVEAGVLQRTAAITGVVTFEPGEHNVQDMPLYSVRQPHKHEWRVTDMAPTAGQVIIRCDGCDAAWSTGTKLPIEGPE